MSGFRDLKVVARQRESSIITSFHLEPVDPQGWRDFRPGQYLVFRIPKLDGGGFVLRNYSVSCAPGATGRYRITVKREAHGLGSGFLHDCIEPGDILSAEGPRGDFALDAASDRPVVLLSGGVGLTPLTSMLHALAGTEPRVVFIHACDNGEVHALREEVEAAVAARPGMAAHFVYRFPSEADRNAARHHSEGMVTRELLQQLLPLDDYDFYMCGPTPFMQAVHDLLRGLGVPTARIAYEFFGPAMSLERALQPAPEAAAVQPASAPSGAMVIEFRKSGVAAEWAVGAESLLAFAEDQGLEPDFSCRAGVCGTCKSRLLSGEVAYFEEPLDELAPGEVLLCCSRPKGPLVLDL